MHRCSILGYAAKIMNGRQESEFGMTGSFSAWWWMCRGMPTTTAHSIYRPKEPIMEALVLYICTVCSQLSHIVVYDNFSSFSHDDHDSIVEYRYSHTIDDCGALLRKHSQQYPVELWSFHDHFVQVSLSILTTTSQETRELEAASLLCKGEGLFSPVLTNGSKSCQKINPKPTIKYYLMQ